MKTLVAYKSKTGFTQRYAEWIKEELGCDIAPLDNITADKLAAYDTVIFGGLVHAGRISGLSKMRELLASCGGKSLVVFATGATPAESDAIDAMWKANFPDDGQAQAPHFYMQAGLNYERMGFFDKLIMKGLSAMMSKKKDKTPDEEGTAQAIGSSFDASSRDYIKPLVEYVRSINK